MTAGKRGMIQNAPMRNPQNTPTWLEAARAHWNWRGQKRPPFAVEPGPGQVSVWDFPRPPRVAHDTREVVIRWGDVEVARTHKAVLVLETSHPPSFYIPWADVKRALLKPCSDACNDVLMHVRRLLHRNIRI